MTTARPYEDIAEKLYTVEEWLELEKRADVRHEYVYGKLVPMAGEAIKANRIATNILKRLDDPLLEKGLLIYDHDVKAQVVLDGIYRYPDLVVAPVADDEHGYIVKHLVLMVEVASEDSSHRDRVKKRQEYQKIPSIWYYLVVNQEEMLYPD
ncbi:MAG: Uma2 family endonuclease [Saprospiraceae bacterium]|nr:Uma2 family endonuclease [Saprospiraceae bacterium]